MRNFCAILILLISFPGRSESKFLAPKLQEIPITNAIQNLEKQWEASPDRFSRYALARTYAFAAVFEIKNVKYASFSPKGPKEYVQFTASDMPGKKGELIPRTWRRRPKPSREAPGYLRKALGLLEQSLHESKFSDEERLNYAWTLQQSGAKKEALEQYKIILKPVVAFAQSKNPEVIPVSHPASEAIDLALEVLDSKAEADYFRTLTWIKAVQKFEP